jgi:hypothetical protein
MNRKAVMLGLVFWAVVGWGLVCAAKPASCQATYCRGFKCLDSSSCGNCFCLIESGAGWGECRAIR